MMDKLVITKEKLKALENFVKDNAEGHLVPNEQLLETFIENKHDWVSESRRKLSTFTPEQFALLLCGWYEVEEPFKVGDWIFRFNNYSQITRVENDNGNIKIFTDKHEGFLYKHEIRKAMPEEIAQEKKRRFWSELGREVDEYRERDIVSVKYKNSWYTESVFVISHTFGVKRVVVVINEEQVPISLDRTKLVTPVEKRLDHD